jgi:hypothetical protein
MLINYSDSEQKIDVSMKVPLSKSWKLLYEIYRVETNKSITINDFLHRNFQRQLLYVVDECKQGYDALDNIYSELKIARKCNAQLDQLNMVEIKASLKQLLNLFGSSYYQKLELEYSTNRYKDVVKYQAQKTEEDSKKINRIASVILTTAGIGFAGFAAIIGASARIMLENDLKSKVLLGLTGGSLAVASISQVAEYFGYDNFDCVIQDLLDLKRSLSDFFNLVNGFGIQLIKLIEEIELYSRETIKDIFFLSNHQSSTTPILGKVLDMIDKTEQCQVKIVKLETYAKENYEFIKRKRKELPRKKSIIYED